MAPTPGRPEPRIPRRAAAVMVCALAALAAVFWKDVVGKGPPLDDIPKLDKEFWSPATVRNIRKAMTSEGAPCQSCHEGTEPLQGNPSEKGVFHEKIELKHGRNKLCFNCHHRARPDTFADYDGTPIDLAKIELLCAKCHGTHFRDWNSGAHGRRTGTFDPARGKPLTTVCIGCHDPHWPLFKPMKAAAAPHVNPRTREAKAAGAAHGDEGGLH